MTSIALDQLSSAATPTVWPEETFLQSYFLCLSKFAYDKAKEITDKEREETKAHASLLWSSLLNLLNTLSSSEKAFYSLLFLSSHFAWIKRKDTLRTSYSCLLTELKRIEKAHSAVQVQFGGDTLEIRVGHLCSQLQHFITARIKTIGFYEQIDTLGQSRVVSPEETEDLLGVVTEISSGCQSALKHSLLNPLLSSFSLECDCITHLLQAQMAIQSCRYLPALLELFSAHTKLNSWQLLIAAKDPKKLGFVSSSKPWSPALYDWLTRYRNALVSKFSLYFYDVLCRQGSQSDVKALTAKMSTDYYAKISTFHKRSDASNISLLFNAQQQQRGSDEEPFAGLGYHLRPSTSPPQGGHDGYYAILGCPTELSDYHWQQVRHFLQHKRPELDAAIDKPLHLCHEGRQSSATYFFIRVDPLVTLLVVFDSKKTERDSGVTQFMCHIASELRCTKQFSTLRPGHK